MIEKDNFVLLNIKKLPQLSKNLQGSEIKILLLILFYLGSTGKKYLINNEEWRNFMESMDFKITPVRTSTLLSSLVKKGILKREVKGVFSIADNSLYLSSNTINN